MMTLFTEPADRAKAMGIFGFVAAGGGSIGVLLGGILTDLINWHWIFLVNFPIGILVVVLSLRLLPADQGTAATGRRLDVAGAVTVAAALLTVFLVIESRVSSPLVPLGLFKLRNIAVSNVVGVLWAAAMFAWFFLSALYLQLVLGYSPLQVGLSFLPANL